MCWQCNDPSDSDAEEDIDGLRASVREHGWAIKYVEDHRRPYAYTMGLHELGPSELLVTGVTTERAFALLDYFVEETMTKGGTPEPGDRIVLSDTAKIDAVRVGRPDVHLGARFGCSDRDCARCNWSGLIRAGVGRGTSSSTSTA
jgi:Domain of unknown function (DUF4262)